MANLSEHAENVSFPMVCPECNAPRGMPYIATTMLQNGAICVGLRCGACRHEWEFQMPVTMPTLGPKTDRRKASRI